MIQAVDDYFDSDASEFLEYCWPRGKNSRNYDQTIVWKSEKSAEWRLGDRNKRISIAHDIVVKWGGIPRNKPENLERYVDLAGLDDPPLPIERVTTYSKIFAIANPEKYAIYDSRVAAALNAVQIIFSKPHGPGVFFNYPQGRNTKIYGKSGFTKTFGKKLLVDEGGWQSLERDNTYREYLKLIKSLSDRRGHPLVHFEMTLFANAEKLCGKAREQYKGGCYQI
ncbi:hypothetical protein IGS68_31880 (plasmid) [Skermanella sp. TT6]|uniref:Uncharacterized protein n=1 Tax=Skermanella cutis TaxID=2775420 RepID=A0ABX7BGY3_9PROT|nr:hypothetical protein [Skermanella sp. TT6]QQP93622.1 hypothetical protein IGS68_31880 [Skermanella sp. TT6]